MKVAGLLLFLPLVAACGSTSIGDEIDRGSCAPGLRLTVVPKAKPEWYPGPGPIVTAQLRNDGERPVWLRKGGKLHFEVRDSSGREVPWGGFPPNVDGRSRGELGVMKVGDVDPRDKDLSIHHKLVTGERYSVIAYYDAETRGPGAPPPGACVFTGTLVSTPIVVEGPPKRD